ncbi:N-acetyltransferase [Gulosibacter macacae]|uniref:N-acetyltransferase n=1 Tax=Gulosibacter macacae TaxID=2488791 RepID=A0A3P3VY19_9MICO|nr:GNAT family protein [Gulosibacter macacae]RRJ86506.1 N-acetyltransferase [Gulosibacter macacae]
MSTERLELRVHQAGDVAWMHALYSQPEVARYLLEEPWTQEVAETRVEERLAKNDLDGEAKVLVLAIEHAGEPIGEALLWFTDAERRVAEIGWVLDPRFGGRGFAAEAVTAVLDLAFDHYRVHRVAAQMDARNTGSARLAERVGMTREAHLRQDWWSKGEWTDTVIYGMLAADR